MTSHIRHVSVKRNSHSVHTTLLLYISTLMQMYGLQFIVSVGQSDFISEPLKVIIKSISICSSLHRYDY